MVISKDLNELYVKWVLIIAIILISLGVVLISTSPDSPFLIVVATAFIQLGIALFVVDLVVSKIGNKLFQQQIMSGFRKILGIENPNSKLFPELIRLMRPHPYHVLSIDVENRLVYGPVLRNSKYNLTINEKTTVIIQAKEDNVNYRFYRGSDDGNLSKFQLREIKLDEHFLDVKKDLIINKNVEKKRTEYTVKYNLKDGKTYTLELDYKHPSCMSDLSRRDVKEDILIHQFIELTNKAKLKFIFPFDLKNYVLMARRIDACQREELIAVKLDKNTVLIEQENLYNGDIIQLTYKKK